MPLTPSPVTQRMDQCATTSMVAPPFPTPFPPDFLRRFANRDEPPFAHEAEMAGLGTIWPLDDGGFALYLPGESFDRGHRPVGTFRERWRALLAAAVLAGTGRDPLYVLRPEADPDGFALICGLDREGRPEVAGHLQLFDEALAGALHVAESLLRSPESLAARLEAAGGVALGRAGTVLDARVAPPAG
jgi:hypothetical protein